MLFHADLTFQSALQDPVWGLCLQEAASQQNHPAHPPFEPNHHSPIVLLHTIFPFHSGIFLTTSNTSVLLHLHSHVYSSSCLLDNQDYKGPLAQSIPLCSTLWCYHSLWAALHLSPFT